MKKKVLFSAVTNILMVFTPLILDLLFFFLVHNSAVPDYASFNRISPFVIIAFLFILILIEAISSATIYDSTYHTTLLTVMFFAYFITCKASILNTETVFNIKLWSFLFDSLHYLAFLICACAMFNYFRYLYFPHYSVKKFLIIALSTIPTSCGLYVGLGLFGYSHIATFISVGFFIFVIFWFYVQAFKKLKINFNFFFLLLICSCLTGSEMIGAARDFGLNAPLLIDWQIVYFFILLSAYVSIYINFIVEKVKGDESSIAYAKELKTIKPVLLSNQMKPHYIFNTLNSIKALYRRDFHLGEQAVDHLAIYLRNHVEVTDNKMIHFSQELSHINNYIELENLKNIMPFNIIYDIDFEDFEVPFLSIEPFIENAIRYSEINKRKDGYLQLTAHRKNNNCCIFIEDNGIGFDTTLISSQSVGIKNSKERLRIMLGAEVKVESKIGEGTKISINFPLGRVKEND